MTPQSTPDVKSIFGRALELNDPVRRAAYLDEVCGGAPEVRVEVQGLLDAFGEAGSFMRSPAALLPNTEDYDSPITEGEGTVIGPYTLREQIGEGGFGLVFVAEQHQPVRRKVALKVIKPGMDTRAVVARFEAERQALAMMDHSHIAKVYDAGTTDTGRPYFVMELVRGVPITEYADANNLAPRQRLELFVQVCQAVQHAHQKGVIHRDLKPSNILVAPHDGVPVVKVIDFGIAKALGQSLTDKTIYTRFAQMIGTPLYMSPEQAEVNQLDVDTRSDIYSLGVLLYELLTSTTPFDQQRFQKAAFDEIRRIIKEEEPPRPSTRLTSLGATLTAVSAKRGTDPGRLAGIVRGELDWIVMRCLEKDRSRRYDTATGLAKDVQRYLSGDAVEACPPTLGYRLRKAYRRNRAMVLVGSTIALVLLAATGVSLAFAVLADRSKQAALVAEGVAARDRDTAHAAQAEADRKRLETDMAKEKLRFAQDRQQADQYVWDMQLLPLAFETGNVSEAKRLLYRHLPHAEQPDRRGFEWHYWDRQINGHVREIDLPDVAPGGVWAASADGSTIVQMFDSGESDPRQCAVIVNVWDTATGRLRTHRFPIYDCPAGKQFILTQRVPPAVAVSDDGRRIAGRICLLMRLRPDGDQANAGRISNSDYMNARFVLDTATGQPLLMLKDSRHELRDHTVFMLSPSGNRLATDEHVVYDVDSGVRAEYAKPRISPFHASRLPVFLSFSRDGSRYLTSRRGTQLRKSETPELTLMRSDWTQVSLRESDTGKELVSWNVKNLLAACLSSDGTHVAGVVPVGEIDEVPVDFDARRIAEPEDRNATPTGSSLHVWDAQTGEKKLDLPLNGLRGKRVTVAFDPGGSRVAVVTSKPKEISEDTAPRAELVVADLRTGKLGPIITFTDDSRQAAIGELPPWSMVSIYGKLGFTPDGTTVIRVDGDTIRTWSAINMDPRRTIRCSASEIVASGLSSDGRRVWVVEQTGRLREWDLEPHDPGDPVTIPSLFSQEARGAELLTLSADGSRVAGVVPVGWNPDEPEKNRPAQITRGHRERLTPQPPIGPLGVQIWDTRGRPIRKLVPPPLRDDGPDRPLPARSHRVALSHDGRAVALVRGKTLMVWEVDTGSLLYHEPLIASGRVVLSPGGNLAAVIRTIDSDTSCRLIDLRNPTDPRAQRLDIILEDCNRYTGLDDAAFSPDGSQIAFVWQLTHRPGEPSRARLGVWETATGRQIAESNIGVTRRTTGLRGNRLAWSPDGDRIALVDVVQGQPVVGIYDATTLQKALTLDQPTTRKLTAIQEESSYYHSISFSPDGGRIATYVKSLSEVERGFVRVWDAATGGMVLEVRLGRGSGFTIHGPPIVVFASGGRRLLYAREFVNGNWNREGQEIRGHFLIFEFGPPPSESDQK